MDLAGHRRRGRGERGGGPRGHRRARARGGSVAVCAGSDVVPPAAVAAADWRQITERAREFTAALG
ncbi:hypothetical protein [Streptomyces virginiae]|uniref:hypothetical protein n=1 Tax=Streptomyces virginiae TaxID=1961 RepID=UPI0035DD6E4C